MKKLVYLPFLIFSILSFGQINDPTPNFDIEWAYQKPVTAGDEWDFSKKPFKKITENGKVIDKFDSIGRHIERIVIWNHVTNSTITKYKGNQIVEHISKQIYNIDETGKKMGVDRILTEKLNIDSKGKIIDGTSYKSENDSISIIIGHSYYDKKNRLIKTTNSTGENVTNFYYARDNLIRKEEIRQIDTKTKNVTDRTYKYNKDDQIVFYEYVRSTFENNTLKEKKIIQTVKQEYKNKLLVKKVLTDNSETIERTYTYDNNKNLITFIETKKNNSDGLITSQMKRTKKYENNLLIYSEVQEGLSTQQGKFSFTYNFYSDDESLVRQASTDNKGNLEVEYLYNEYGHLVKRIVTFSDTPSSKSETVYEIEYY